MSVHGHRWCDRRIDALEKRAGELEHVNTQLGEFVRAYDRYRLALNQTDHTEYVTACNELDRQYELLDTLGEDRP